MISKELLNAVLKINRIQSIEVKEDMLLGNTNTFLSITHLHSQGRAFADTIQEININIYELQHMMKEWAWNNGYRIKSQLLFQYFHIDVSKYSSDFVENVVFFKEMTEPEAIFKAGEWILKELQDA